METPFEKPPIGYIESQKRQITSFSADSLRNPAVSMDPNKSGKYPTYIYKAQDLLQKIQEGGFWSQQQAETYAKNYPGLPNALEVMKRNTLLRNIVEDRPMDMTWGYEERENNDLVYRDLDKIVHFEELDKEKKLREAIARVSRDLKKIIGKVPITADLEREYKRFWRIKFSRTLEGEDYSFYVNVDTDKKSVAILSHIPPTEILYAFSAFKTVPLIKNLLEKHPRLNIQLPPETEERIRARRKSEREYQEKVAKLSATNEISQTTDSFESGIYVKQGNFQIISADKGPIGTTDVGPCVAVCARGKTEKDEMILGFAHMEAGQNANEVLSRLEAGLISSGVPKEKIEMFLVGGWRSTEELQKRLLALSGEFNIKGIKINLKAKDREYPQKKNYIDVVIDRGGKVVWGENGEIFKVKEEFVAKEQNQL